MRAGRLRGWANGLPCVIMSDPEPMPQRLEIEAGPDIEPAVYADFAALWHTPAIFVMDFAALMGPAQHAQGPDGQAVVDAKARIVARVRMPPQQVFELMKALEQQLSAYEQEAGQRPSEPPITM